MRTFAYLTGAVVILAITSAPRAAQAATYEVGPGKEFAQVGDVLSQLEPGDVIEVQGNATYEPFDYRFGAEAGNPVIIRGIKVDGKRPVFDGGENTVILRGNHVVLESVEVTGGSAICIVHKADDVLIRDVIVHDCPGHGILGTDEESGSLTIEYSEVYACGSGESRHQLYIATDEVMYPGSVFRLQHSYIHDGNGGNNVKTRAERNEIYYNWIENAVFHELDLIGPDGADTDLEREDSDVVGNVFIKSSEWQIARIGGDGTGETKGRYRFAWNTMVMGSSDVALKAQDGIESLELYNNLVLSGGAGNEPLRFVSVRDAAWTGAENITGANNWLPEDSTDLGDITDTIFGSDPGIEDLQSGDVRPAEGGPLIDAATMDTPSVVARIEALPLFLPPLREVRPVGEATMRPLAGAGLDIGALEFGTGPPVEPPPDGGGGGGGDGGGGGGGNDDASGSCGCRVGGATDGHGWLAGLALLGVAGVVLSRRRRR